MKERTPEWDAKQQRHQEGIQRLHLQRWRGVLYIHGQGVTQHVKEVIKQFKGSLRFR